MRSIVAYLIAAYGFALALSVVLARAGAQATPLAWLSMLIPTVAVVVAGGGAAIDWRRLPMRYVPAALLTMPAVLHASMLPVAFLLAGRIGWKSGSAGHIAVNAAVGVVVVSAMALFEEIGWRAWLLPRLRARWGPLAAVVAVSFLWAAWHVPFVVSGILRPEHVPTAQALAILPVGQFGAGLVLGWFWTRTESIWIVAIAHGALNNWGQYAFKLMRDDPAMVPHEPAILMAGSVALVALGAGLLALSRSHAIARAE